MRGQRGLPRVHTLLGVPKFRNSLKLSTTVIKIGASAVNSINAGTLTYVWVKPRCGNNYTATFSIERVQEYRNLRRLAESVCMAYLRLSTSLGQAVLETSLLILSDMLQGCSNKFDMYSYKCCLFTSC